MSLTFFSTGYIVFDLIICLTDIQDFSPLGMQNIAHHICVCFGTISTIPVRGIFTTTTACAAFTEVSTILLHVRFYMIKYKKASGTPFLIVMISFISLFTYSRIYVFLLSGIAMLRVQYYYPQATEGKSVLFVIIGDLMLLIMLSLNFFWF